MRASAALATTVPLFLLLFASACFLHDGTGHPGQLQPPLTRTDALYFTVTMFSTVGYRDTTATSQAARLVVTAQMILDLQALGLGIRVFIGAIQLTRQAHPDPTDPAAPPEQPPQ